MSASVACGLELMRPDNGSILLFKCAVDIGAKCGRVKILNNGSTRKKHEMAKIKILFVFVLFNRKITTGTAIPTDNSGRSTCK